MDDKRIKILTAAFNVFKAKGFHEAKISEIAKEAEIGKGTVYEYFSSKQSLFEEMMIFILHMYRDMLINAVKDGKTPEEKLKIYLDTEWRVRSENSHMMELVISRMEHFGESLKMSFMTVRQEMSGIIEEILRDGVEQGVFKAVNIKMFTIMFSGSFNEAHFQYNIDCMINGRDAEKAEAVKNELFEIILNGLRS